MLDEADAPLIRSREAGKDRDMHTHAPAAQSGLKNPRTTSYPVPGQEVF